jgi:hypothetical protein
VVETRKGEKGQRIHAQKAWKTNIFLLIYFMFACITRSLITLCADRGQPVDNLLAGQRKGKPGSSKKSEHMLDKQKDLVQT